MPDFENVRNTKLTIITYGVIRLNVKKIPNVTIPTFSKKGITLMEFCNIFVFLNS
jgi:hypothetical protein